MLIVDAHHHLWKVERGDYQWMSPDDAVLCRDFLPDDLRPLLRKAGVNCTVVVQAAETEAETEFLLSLAEKTDFIAGVVGWLDFEDPEFAAKLERLLTRPKFVGLRPMLQDMDDDHYILRPSVMANLQHLSMTRAALDILVYPRHLPAIVQVLDAVPRLKAVIDHAAKPAIYEGRIASWADDIANVARFSNIFCKLSGMVTEASHDDWKPFDLAPFVHHLLDVFGPERVMFGSDWPVCLLAASYAEVLNALRFVADPLLTSDEMEKLYGRNAERFYGLDISDGIRT